MSVIIIEISYFDLIFDKLKRSNANAYTRKKGYEINYTPVYRIQVALLSFTQY